MIIPLSDDSVASSPPLGEPRQSNNASRGKDILVTSNLLYGSGSKHHSAAPHSIDLLSAPLYLTVLGKHFSAYLSFPPEDGKCSTSSSSLYGMGSSVTLATVGSKLRALSSLFAYVGPASRWRCITCRKNAFSVPTNSPPTGALFVAELFSLPMQVYSYFFLSLITFAPIFPGGCLSHGGLLYYFPKIFRAIFTASLASFA